jgi:hypothetical protein
MIILARRGRCVQGGQTNVAQVAEKEREKKAKKWT